MRVLVLALLALTGCPNERLVPSAECGSPCFPDAGREIGPPHGTCRTGTVRCELDGSSSCVGAVLPTAETCNGVDDDCDGYVDNNSESFRRCSTACDEGVELCKNGGWTACSARQPQPEICNGKDDDCDDRIDEPEDLKTADGGSNLHCYAGPGGSEQFGICHGGSLRCVAAQYVCYGQQTPLPETCNGVDDDCDNAIDNGATQNENLDMVIVFDNSGSMAQVASNLKQATQNWVNKYSANTERHYALVVAPDNDVMVWYPRIWTGFTDAAHITLAIGDQTGEDGTGAEPTLDALRDILNDMVTPTLRNRDGTVGLTWRPGSHRVIVMFTDEHPQSYSAGCFGECPALENDLIARLAISGVTLHVFTSMADWNSWLALSNASGGQNWNLADTTAVLEQDLDAILRKATCQP